MDFAAGNWSKSAVFGPKLQNLGVADGANWSKSMIFMKFMKTVDFQGLWVGLTGQKPWFSSKTTVFDKKVQFSAKNYSFSRFCVAFEFKTKLVF